jgi:single-strand binding protein|nr:MAG TPA: Single strand binding protein [Caudoviricetes sp.]
MNRVILMGRLTRDPDIRYTSGENSMAVARYTLAIDRTTKKQDEQSADFISCVAFSKAAEFAEKYFRQGMRVLVSGRLQTSSYTNREGQKIYTTDVILDSQEFADSKGDSTEAKGKGRREANVDADGFMNIPDGVDDEGLPFN